MPSENDSWSRGIVTPRTLAKVPRTSKIKCVCLLIDVFAYGQEGDGGTDRLIFAQLAERT